MEMMSKQIHRRDHVTESYDAVVVGSGYGGSVAACRMSVEGFPVCLVEKGRRYGAQDFPKDGMSIFSTVRVVMRRWGFWFRYGSDQALFQIHDQGDSLALVACGLGGGSLINAGVVVPTPMRARRDPKWPKEWNKDWELYERYASAMLDAQSSPEVFPNARVMQQIVDEEIEEFRPDPIKLSINFGKESQGTSSCIACGNCLSGCPYNAKNSTDKNYLASAIQDGCVVKTERKVLYIVENPDLIFEEMGATKPQRRWRVYFDDLEYITADFVVLSAGVLGTSEILFQSRKRGLGVSKRLGLGLSCNGNNVAYVADSQAPLHAHGLDKKQILKIPFKSRPGPSISSSYTSSLGFTIQSAVVPESYPNFLFKGIVTYGWPSGSWFVHGLIYKLKQLMGFAVGQEVVLNVMGHDSSDGVITLDDETEMIRVTPPNDPLLPKKIQAFRTLANRLGGILFMSRYRSTSVHLLGGCNAASDPLNGVCNSKGQVFNPNHDQGVTHEGLYVCDGSLIPCSVGKNPSLTISTIAEHVSQILVQDISRHKSATKQLKTSKENFKEQEENDFLLVNNIVDSRSVFTSKKLHAGVTNNSEDLVIKPQDTVTIRETIQGFIGGMPCTSYLVIKMNLWGHDNISHQLLKGTVGGHVTFPAVNKDRLFVVDGWVNMCHENSRTPYTQYMHYKLILAASSGSRYILEGRKIMNPYLLGAYVLKESTTLHVTFTELNPPYDHYNIDHKPTLQGELHITAFELFKSFVTLKGRQRGSFVSLLLKSLWRTYITQIPRQKKETLNLVNVMESTYPPSILHELETDDGHKISCRQWRCYKGDSEEKMQRYPVLLLNGYSTESYCLPSEQNDLVRTLLAERHEIWLLQPRLHPSHPSTNFTIEDIGQFDIPAVIKKILELNGEQAKIHVIAHCAGGLAVHIAILGGHVSASHIASVSCTNSSMFFKVTSSARVKMWLPLIPVSMSILGNNRILSMQATKENYRHRIIKLIAHIIPRTERCTCSICETFSGIFGNTFWHENVTETMHQWLNKHSITKLPMSGFPHLRKICNAGFIVDSQGKNKFLIHPERMAVPTLYISGGRSLLVTPETSLMANRYMRLHQPGFVHRRVVVDGFGHSDLLIGEEAHKKVFPHFVAHLKSVENGEGKERKECKEVVEWDCRHDGGVGDWGFYSIVFILLRVFVYIFFLFLSI